MKDGLIEKIKSRGYWRVNFQPITAAVRLDSMQKCKEIVEKNAVNLRGWDFPHIPSRDDETTGSSTSGNYYEGWTDWSNYKEFWQMYKSGQFLSYLALREDWFEESLTASSWAERIKPMTSLSILNSVIYEITEVFEFLSRLTSSGLYEEGVLVNMSLNNIENRELWIEDQARISFSYPRKTKAKELVFNKEYSKEDVINDSKKLANSMILEIFDAFGWNPSSEQISTDQEKILSRN